MELRISMEWFQSTSFVIKIQWGWDSRIAIPKSLLADRHLILYLKVN